MIVGNVDTNEAFIFWKEVGDESEDAADDEEVVGEDESEDATDDGKVVKEVVVGPVTKRENRKCDDPRWDYTNAEVWSPNRPYQVIYVPEDLRACILEPYQA